MEFDADQQCTPFSTTVHGALSGVESYIDVYDTKFLVQGGVVAGGARCAGPAW